ncbi:MAG: PspC domain-containing protein [Bacteroides sp.]|nr:PspC domain-containing protein [Bacteroides sp.]
MMDKKLERPRAGRKLSGVCAALANYFGLDVSLVRIIYVLLTIFSAAFPGILIYIILLIVIPEEKNRYLKD